MTHLLVSLLPCPRNIMFLASFACGHEKEQNVSYAAWSSDRLGHLLLVLRKCICCW